MYNKIVLFCLKLPTGIKSTANIYTYITGEEPYKYLYASILILLLSHVSYISIIRPKNENKYV